MEAASALCFEGDGTMNEFAKMIDSHIHLDHYTEAEIKQMAKTLEGIQSVMTVSFDLASCQRNWELSKQYPWVHTAFGFHPEQELPNEEELESLIAWMEKHKDDMAAVGEVGLPYYKREKGEVTETQQSQYLDLLETFIVLAKRWGKPIVLHAVYDDAPLVCDLLEKHSISKAHFHWFKGDPLTLERMARNGYFISVTPDIVYETEIQEMINSYPLGQIMVETDGPWPFEGPFEGLMTHPVMMHKSIETIADIKRIPPKEVYGRILDNTKKFYSL